MAPIDCGVDGSVAFGATSDFLVTPRFDTQQHRVLFHSIPTRSPIFFYKQLILYFRTYHIPLSDARQVLKSLQPTDFASQDFHCRQPNHSRLSVKNSRVHFKSWRSENPSLKFPLSIANTSLVFREETTRLLDEKKPFRVICFHRSTMTELFFSRATIFPSTTSRRRSTKHILTTRRRRLNSATIWYPQATQPSSEVEPFISNAEMRLQALN